MGMFNTICLFLSSCLEALPRKSYVDPAKRLSPVGGYLQCKRSVISAQEKNPSLAFFLTPRDFLGSNRPKTFVKLPKFLSPP